MKHSVTVIVGRYKTSVNECLHMLFYSSCSRLLFEHVDFLQIQSWN